MRRSLSALIAGAVMVGAALTSVPSLGAPAFAARSSDAAGVRVVVTPRELTPGATTWEFDVVLDTHVKPLADDIAAASVLVDGGGNRVTPVAWQGDPPGGHHRKGTLKFPAPGDMPKTFELQLAGVGGVGLRSFRWEMK